MRKLVSHRRKAAVAAVALIALIGAGVAFAAQPLGALYVRMFAAGNSRPCPTGQACIWRKTSDNTLHYADPAGDTQLGVASNSLTGTLTTTRIPFASSSSSLTDDASLTYNTGTTPPELVQAGGWHSHNAGLTVRPSADNTFGAGIMLDSAAHSGGNAYIIAAAGDNTSYPHYLTFWDDTNNLFRAAFSQSGHFLIANSGGSLQDDAESRLTVYGNITAYGTGNGYVFGDGSIQTTAATGNTTASLTSGRLPVASGTSTLTNSNFTAAANALDLSAAGTASLFTSTATAISLGHSGITTTITGGLTQSTGAVSLTGNAASSFTTTVGNTTIDSAAACQLGPTNATSIAMGHSGITTTITGGLTQSTGAVSLTGNAASSFTTSVGNTTIDSAAACQLGSATATSVAIGRSGITTTITGGLTQQTGAVQLTGNAASTFTTSSGNTTIDSAGVCQLGSSTATSVTLGRSGINVFLPGGVIRASTPGTNGAGVNFSICLNNGGAAGGGAAAGAAGANTYTSGQGGAATSNTGETSTSGGTTILQGGQGGSGAASVNGPASGGGVQILGGNAGSLTSGFSGANGGNVVIRGGALSGTGTAGTVTIGDANTSSITVGAAATPITVSGAVQAPLPAKWGTTIASAATIAPTTWLVEVSGTTTISTITVPSACAQTGIGCCIKLVPTGAWATNTAGNIALASTAVVSRTLEECWNNTDSKWYPSY
jgi:hypothetical protein